MKETTAAEYLNWLASMIVALENEEDCVGATWGHIAELMKKDVLDPDQTLHMKHFMKVLEEQAEQQEVDNEFMGIVFDLTGGDEK